MVLVPFFVLFLLAALPVGYRHNQITPWPREECFSSTFLLLNSSLHSFFLSLFVALRSLHKQCLLSFPYLGETSGFFLGGVGGGLGSLERWMKPSPSGVTRQTLPVRCASWHSIVYASGQMQVLLPFMILLLGLALVLLLGFLFRVSDITKRRAGELPHKACRRSAHLASPGPLGTAVSCLLG